MGRYTQSVPMGVRGLMTYIHSLKKYADMKQKHLSIGLDGYCLLYTFKDKTHAFEQYLRNLQALRHTLTFVMDCKASDEKKQVMDQRREARDQAEEEAQELRSFLSSEDFEALHASQKEAIEKKLEQTQRNAWHMTSAHMIWLKEMLQTLQIPLVWAEGEADEALAKGAKQGQYSVVVSSDSDLLILGVETLWIPRGVGIQHTELRGMDFRRFVGLAGADRLFELAYLAGCDVQPRSLVPFATAVSWLRFYGSLEKVHEKFPEKVSQKDLETFAAMRSPGGCWCL